MNRFLIYPTIYLIVLSVKCSPVESATTSETPNVTEFRILLWTKFFGLVWTEYVKRELTTNQSVVSQLNCSFTNCLLSEDRSNLVNTEAILFHWRDINTTDLPQQHISGQKWVLYNLESPHFTSEDQIKPLIKEIDWTMTYRKDSDIYVPYGSVQKCDNKWQNEDLFDKKTKSIAWVVSNCETPSKREEFAKELSNYIDVDIYGKCGPNECKRDPNDTCFKTIGNTYKFYLSFENSLCKDYVTEKLFRTLTYDIIPIVYGWADYNQTLPTNSFINAMDFPSAKELSEYLKTISGDKQKYNSYLKWKTSYCVQQTKHRYFCDLCEKLNRNVVNKTKSNVQPKRDLIDWWFNESVCKNLIRGIASKTNSIHSYIVITFLLHIYIKLIN